MLLYRVPASYCNVTNAAKPYDFSDMNAEACVDDQEPFDREEDKELDAEKEFGT